MAVFFQKIRGDGHTHPAGSGYWNLWRTAQTPYNLLAAGDRVILIRPRTGKVPAEFAFDVTVDKPPLTATYQSKREAIKLIAEYLGDPVSEIQGDPYTQAKPDVSGVLLAWRVAGGTAIDRPVTAGFRLAQNGWRVLDELAVTKLGL